MSVESNNLLYSIVFMRSVFCHCTVTQSGTQLYLFLIFLGNGMLGYYVSNPYAEVNKNDKWN